MDSYHHHQPNPYSQTPPPPPPDPRAAFPPPPPPGGSWYHHHHPVAQPFQFHPSPPPPQPPPPGHPLHWAPPPYHQQPPLQHPYGIPPPPYQNQYLPPRPPPYHQSTHAYPNQPQEWGNEAHHPSLDHPVGRNEEDWASRAKAWAASRAATDSEHQQSQFGTVGRFEEPSHYPTQYPSSAESQYQDTLQPAGPIPGYQNYPVQGIEMRKQPLAYSHVTPSISSGQSSCDADQYYSYRPQDGNSSSEAGSSFPSRQQLTGSSFHQQEVPFSYPSIPGNEDVAHRQQGFQLPSLALHGNGPTEPAHFTHTNQLVDPRDRPLEFTPRFSLDNNPKMPSTYESAVTERGKDSIGALPSLHPWTSSGGPGVSFPSIPPTFPSAPQLVSSIQRPQLLGLSTSFSTAISSIGTATGLDVAILPGDAYGVPIGFERPKKAAVPNWLREEIIKKAATVGSASNHLTEESQSLEDDTIDKSVGKGDQADSKSMDSSKLTEVEDEEEEEDDAEAARTAAINQEIKCVLTEVLLKVTDELLDDIATRVLDEDDIPVAITAGNHTAPALLAPKASAKVLIPVKAMESDAENASGKNGSRSTGNVLGLANYASDDDDEDEDEDEKENQFSTKPVPSNTSLPITTANDEISDNVCDAVANVHSNAGSAESKKSIPDHVLGANSNTSTASVSENIGVIAANLGHNGLFNKEDSGDKSPPDMAVLSRKDDVSIDYGKDSDGSDASNLKTDVNNLSGSNSECHEVDDVKKSTTIDSDVRESRQSSRYESARSLDPGDSSEDIRTTKVKEEIKRDSNHGRQDTKQQKKDKIEDKHGFKVRSKEDVRNGFKERSKEDVRHGQKTREANSRECSPRQGDRGSRKESERVDKVSDKHDMDRKRQQGKDEAAERSRDKVRVEVTKHKTRHSPSVGSRSRNGKDRSIVREHGDSSDEASDESKRKRHSKRKNQSPSPSSSRKRYSFLTATYLKANFYSSDPSRRHVQCAYKIRSLPSVLSAGIPPTLLLKPAEEGDQGTNHLFVGRDESSWLAHGEVQEPKYSPHLGLQSRS
ncbi:hypothetical protein AKJ16_DCAP17830 [Drosera capensis]